MLDLSTSEGWSTKQRQLVTLGNLHRTSALHRADAIGRLAVVWCRLGDLVETAGRHELHLPGLENHTLVTRAW